MINLSGKCTLVTGASGAIGEAIARTLHEAGASVALAGTRADRLQALAAALGDRAHVAVGDLSSAEGADAVAAAAEQGLGQIDILVNNAGMTRDNLAMRMKDEEFESVLQVNLVSAFRLSRAVMRGMMRRRWGRLIGVTSVVAFMGNPGQANYAASKAGMVGMTKSLAAELAARGITVNCVAPGFIDSPMTEALTDDQKTRIQAGIPAGRLGAAADVAGAVAYLASDLASYVTGQTLHVNGGLAMP